ncbi:aminodeoxychorismate synthase component I [Bacillus niameyensis]|uniref:aminodeoxychorismate synthase component I n=1 Tax=Bacillus niameyensis TaxID=1522308 RepID=UPI000784F22F|nr:aminodeoxychorismate synthase component I [Bacillus niameyensis]
MEKPILYEKHVFSNEAFFEKYFALSENLEHHILLESGRAGRYSIAGLRPFAVISGDSEGIKISQGDQESFFIGEPLAELENWMSQFSFPRQPNLPDFQGGVIGYISYDYGQFIEDLPDLAADDLQLPVIYFLAFDEWVVFDHEKNCLWFMVLNRDGANEKLANLKKQWLTAESEQEVPIVDLPINQELHVSFTEEKFIEAVQKTQAYIKAGDVFQVNLSVRQSRKSPARPIEVYKELRKLNPSPYMGYVHTPEFQIVSGSPELLIKKDGTLVSTRPIAGTRPRGLDDQEDIKLANELIENEKERAEHIMLVDLERNDLGRVCQFGTVQVDEFMTVEKYSHVMHIVSHVSGKLAEEKSPVDLIEAVFPGGTITGAPKIRTLEIIEELEPVKRGIYTGSLGWIGFNNDLELNIVIRTMLVQNEMCHVQAGAGIVIDSNPESEYQESLKKAEALWRALEAVEKRGRND